jgi:hypothetical protein
MEDNLERVRTKKTDEKSYNKREKKVNKGTGPCRE